jgi:hypothetical protein
VSIREEHTRYGAAARRFGGTSKVAVSICTFVLVKQVNWAYLDLRKRGLHCDPSCASCIASAYVSIRQQTSACVSIRQHTSACVRYVSIRQHASAYATHACASNIAAHEPPRPVDRLYRTEPLASVLVQNRHLVSIRQHTSAYVSIRQHTSAYVSIRQHTSETLASVLVQSRHLHI